MQPEDREWQRKDYSSFEIPRGGNCQFVVSKRATLCCRNFSFVLIVVVSSKSNFT